MIVRLAALVCVSSVILSVDAMAQFRDTKLDQRAWACSGAYSQFPMKVINGKDRERAICAGEGKRKPMARAQAYDRCRAQFSATSLLVNWTSNGWYCRYYGH